MDLQEIREVREAFLSGELTAISMIHILLDLDDSVQDNARDRMVDGIMETLEKTGYKDDAEYFKLACLSVGYSAL